MRRQDEEKPYISVSSSVGLDAYRVFLVTFISAAYITEQQHKNNNGVAVALLQLCVQYVWNKEGKLFSQAVLCFIIGFIDPVATHTALSLPVGLSGTSCDPLCWLLLQRLNCFGIFNNYINGVKCFPMWLSGFYGLAVYFPSFDSKLLPMAYSLTFNLLALLCTLPWGGKSSCCLLPVFCLLFRFVLQGLIIKTKFFWTFVLWKMSE